MNIAIIPAAGNSVRMGDDNKLFLQVKGMSVIEYSIATLEKHEHIDEVVVVTQPDNFEHIAKISSRVFLVEGGKTRQESVESAVKFIGDQWGKSEDIVLIVHNGANPLVTDREITESLEGAREHGAAVVGRFSVNTVKEVENGFVKRTLEREKLFEVQTPQAVRFDLFVDAIETARESGFVGTDDVSLVENIGVKVKHVEADERNFKITTPGDLDYFNYLIEKNGL